MQDLECGTLKEIILSENLNGRGKINEEVHPNYNTNYCLSIRSGASMPSLV